MTSFFLRVKNLWADLLESCCVWSTTKCLLGHFVQISSITTHCRKLWTVTTALDYSWNIRESYEMSRHVGLDAKIRAQTAPRGRRSRQLKVSLCRIVGGCSWRRVLMNYCVTDLVSWINDGRQKYKDASKMTLFKVSEDHRSAWFECLKIKITFYTKRI